MTNNAHNRIQPENFRLSTSHSLGNICKAVIIDIWQFYNPSIRGTRHRLPSDYSLKAFVLVINRRNLIEAFWLKLWFNLKVEASQTYLNYVWWLLEPILHVIVF